MRFNDLLRNREAKAGIIAKLPLWTLRIKPLEHFAQSLLWSNQFNNIKNLLT
jgi:hypothetical protein